MRISEVIRRLTQLEMKYGNLEVCFFDEHQEDIRRCDGILIDTRDIQEFPERVYWKEDCIVMMYFYGESILEHGRFQDSNEEEP